MNKILKRLDRVHQNLIDTVEPLTANAFEKRPSAEEWSVSEIVQHLTLVEARVLKDLSSALKRGPRRISFVRKLVPTFIVASRLVRVKAPKAVNPTTVPEKNDALANFNRVRESLKALCDEHDKQQLKKIVFKHPFLGEINGVATVSFVSYHEQRHLKQIREVLKRLN